MKYWQKCPVCDGRGLVGGGFFDSPGYMDEDGNRTWVSDHASEDCRVCGSSGLVETPENEER